MERKTREAEMLTARLVEESERRAAEASKLKDELLKAREAEKYAKEKLLDFLNRTTYNNSIAPSPISVTNPFLRPQIFLIVLFQSVTSLLLPMSSQLSSDLPMLSTDNSHHDLNLNHSMNSYDLINTADADQLSIEIERER